MDYSFFGATTSATSAVSDRPPRSPVRTLSRKQLQFTRSSAFPSIRRRSSHKYFLPLTIRWIQTIWMATLFVFVYLYWSSSRTLFLSTLRPPNSIHLSDFPTILLPRKQAYTNSSHKIEGILTHSSKSERTKLLLEILHDAKNRSMRWPPYLKLHQTAIKGATGTTTDDIVRSCIVTAYFRLNSKHDRREYDTWMQNMLSMHDCMVIFCESDMVEAMIQHRNKTKELTAIVEIQLDNLPISKYYYFPTANTPTEFWEHQFAMDPEKAIHRGYEVFWIWLSKSWFVSTAALLQHHIFAATNEDRDVATIEAWMWADIGSFRDKGYSNDRLIQHIDDKEIFPDPDAVLWMAHRKPDPPSDPFWNRKLYKKEKHHFYHSGSQAIATSVQAWTNFHEEFVHTLDEYASKGLFLGEDQCVLQTTCLLYPKSCAYVQFDQVHDNKYFGIRHVVRYGPHNGQKWNLPQLQLWHPPTLNASKA
jgi:hypothetical protein